MLKYPKLFKNKIKLMVIALLVIAAIPAVVSTKFSLPVEDMNRSSYNQQSFWAYPWGRSVTHKGVDIFAPRGTRVMSSTRGLVVLSGHARMGGNFVLVLDGKLQLHYYAHLDEIKTGTGSFVGSGTLIGTVGDTGNAHGKPYHLHYAIMTMIPYPWKIDAGVQGWRKMFYLNPIKYLNSEL
jgi:murein DD-endopeptidase MepM/ murein hydrolase activator NlpD